MRGLGVLCISPGGKNVAVTCPGAEPQTTCQYYMLMWPGSRTLRSVLRGGDDGGEASGSPGDAGSLQVREKTEVGNRSGPRKGMPARGVFDVALETDVGAWDDIGCVYLFLFILLKYYM